MRKCGNTSRCTRVKQHKGTHEFKKKTRETHRGPGRMWLRSVGWRSTLLLRYSEHTLLAPGPGRENPGESNNTPQASVEAKPSGEAG